jgi:hypothetical protein
MDGNDPAPASSSSQNKNNGIHPVTVVGVVSEPRRTHHTSPAHHPPFPDRLAGPGGQQHPQSSSCMYWQATKRARRGFRVLGDSFYFQVRKSLGSSYLYHGRQLGWGRGFAGLRQFGTNGWQIADACDGSASAWNLHRRVLESMQAGMAPD